MGVCVCRGEGCFVLVRACVSAGGTKGNGQGSPVKDKQMPSLCIHFILLAEDLETQRGVSAQPVQG